MARLLRHRQTKGAESDRSILPPPRHIPTLPCGDILLLMESHDMPRRVVSRFEIRLSANGTQRSLIVAAPKVRRRIRQPAFAPVASYGRLLVE